jgi:hypothetical protein
MDWVQLYRLEPYDDQVGWNMQLNMTNLRIGDSDVLKWRTKY